MIKSNVRSIAFVLSVCVQFVACVGDVTGQGVQELGAACGVSDDCRPGLECEVEHGRGTCQEHGANSGTGNGDAASPSDASSPRDSSGRDDSTGRSDAGSDDSSDADNSSDADGSSDADDSSDAGGSSAGRPAGAACTTAADCATGLECEEEHGVSTCQAHGHGGRD